MGKVMLAPNLSCLFSAGTAYVETLYSVIPVYPIKRVVMITNTKRRTHICILIIWPFN